MYYRASPIANIKVLKPRSTVGTKVKISAVLTNGMASTSGRLAHLLKNDGMMVKIH